MRHCDRELRGVEVSGARRGGPAIASRRAAARGRTHVYEVSQLNRWGSGLGHRSGTLGRSADAPPRP
jgi:hypothetical protein